MQSRSVGLTQAHPSDTELLYKILSHKCMGVNGEDLQVRAVYKKVYFLLQVT